MSGKLVGDVIAWLQTPAAADLALAERAVLMVIAERANEITRDMWRHGTDSQTLTEHIAGALGIKPKALGAVLGKLAGHGLEVRVPIKDKTDSRGRPVYAMRGHATNYRLPKLPTLVSVPTGKWSREEGTKETPGDVDNQTPEAVDNPGEAAPSITGMVPPSREQTDDRSRADGTYPPERSRDGGTPSLNNNPSTTDPSTPSPPPLMADVENSPAAAGPVGKDLDYIDKGQGPDYRAAAAMLQRLPDFGIAYQNRAEAEHPHASRAEVVILAAHLAAKGIPA